MASNNDYTTINTVNNMRVVDDLSKATILTNLSVY